MTVDERQAELAEREAEKRFKITLRGDPTALKAFDWCCPVHGEWSSLEPRATAPDSKPCNLWLSTMDDAGEFSTPAICGLDSPWCMPAPKTHFPVADVIRGSSQERPPDALDTRAIADGMPTGEWRKQRRKKIYTETRDKLIKDVLK